MERVLACDCISLREIRELGNSVKPRPYRLVSTTNRISLGLKRHSSWEECLTSATFYVNCLFNNVVCLYIWPQTFAKEAWETYKEVAKIPVMNGANSSPLSYTWGRTVPFNVKYSQQNIGLFVPFTVNITLQNDSVQEQYLLGSNSISNTSK